MTVVEYDGRIVVVDTGLSFPAPDQLGIDLVLPDFSYLRERAEDIEAIFLTHGHEDHVGALPVRAARARRHRAAADPRRSADGRDGAIEARRAPDEGRAAVRDGAGRGDRGRPVLAGGGQDVALDPRLLRGGAHLRARHHALDRRLQVRPDAGRRRARRRVAPGGARPRRAAAPVRRLHQRRPARASPRRSRAWARTSSRSSAAATGGSWSPRSPRTSTASSRSSTPRPRSGGRSRSSAARCART